MTAQNLMTPQVVTIEMDATINDAVSLFLKHGITALVVRDSQGEALGVFSTTDLAKFDRYHTGGSRGAVFTIMEVEDYMGELHESIQEKSAMHEPVINWMTPCVISVRDADSMQQCCEVLAENNIHRVFVENAESDIVGVITNGDIVKAIANPQ